MDTASKNAIEQLRAGNPLPYAEHIAAELEKTNRELHLHEELIHIGRTQGQAQTLQIIYTDFKAAGLLRLPNGSVERPI